MRVPTACLLLVGTLLSPPPRADGQDGRPPENDPPVIAGVRVGFAGCYKVGLWTPVEVTLRGGSRPAPGELSLVVPDGDGVPSRVATRPDVPCRVLPGQESRVLLYARFGRIRSRLRVEFRDADGRVIAQKNYTADATFSSVGDGNPLPNGRTGLPPAVAASREMIVCLGADPLGRADLALGKGIEEAVGLLGQPADRRTVVARLEDAGQLPDAWYGYEGVDTLVLSTSRPDAYRDLTPTCPRIEALDRWVRMGGKLVLCVGSQAAEFQGNQGLLVPLARFLPGRLETQSSDGIEKVKIYRLRQTGTLETYCAGSVPVPLQEANQAPEVPRLTAIDADASVELQEADLPLVVRISRGFGQLVFFAGDLDREPLSGWRDRPQLASKLLGLSTETSEESVERTAVMRYGFDDLAGQLRSALDQFSEVWPVPFAVVCVLIVVYILLIGPGDYFFLRKVVGRMQWTWLTFPLIVIVFSVGAYLAARWFKGDQLRVNQVDLVDVDVAADARSGLVRGTSWMNIFSPQAKSFNLSLRPKLPDGTVPRDATVTLAWLGLPGEALGGMNPRASHPVLWTEGYDFSPQLDAMRNVPVQIWSTKSLTARWTAQTEVFPRAELADETGGPVGTITNTLGFPLASCFLIYNRRVYTLRTRDNLDEPGRLGTLQPGESTTLDTLIWQSELKTLLTGRKFRKLGDTDRLVATPYKQSSVELPYILQTMMFFEAAGGRRYTGLGNGYQGFVDLTHLLDTHRAVLVGQGPSSPGQQGHGAQLLCKGRNHAPISAQEDQHVTVYRFVFPVKNDNPQ